MSDNGRSARHGVRHERGLFAQIAAQRQPAVTRILRAADRAWQGNVQILVDGQNGFEDRSIACFVRRLPPGGASDIHRHNFEAIGYILAGRGYEIHDGERIDWAAGDVVYIPPNVWHQHLNADPNEEAQVLLITNWPLLEHLGIVTMEPAPSWEEALARPSAIPEPVLEADTAADTG